MNSYEVECYIRERTNKASRDVKRQRMPAADPGKEGRWWVSAAMTIGALLPAGVILSAAASLITVS
jgi:hypothetical protein